MFWKIGSSNSDFQNAETKEKEARLEMIKLREQLAQAKVWRKEQSMLKHLFADTSTDMHLSIRRKYKWQLVEPRRPRSR